MDIRVERNSNIVNFEILKRGAVFKYQKDFYIKTQEQNSVNAVCLKDGLWTHFYADDEICRLTEAYLEIKE